MRKKYLFGAIIVFGSVLAFNLVLPANFQSFLAFSAAETPPAYSFSSNLRFGDSGAEVMNLQRALSSDTSIYPEGLITGYFGPLTKAAVIRFQNKYASEILTPLGLAAGTGFVGPSTRTKLNALYGAGTPASGFSAQTMPVAAGIPGEPPPGPAPEIPTAVSLREAGIELDLPSYYPEELRHPQKLFSGRKIKISLDALEDIKNTRLEMENKTRALLPSAMGEVRRPEKTTLLPKDKILDVLRVQGQEPPELRKQEVSFEIPQNADSGVYNLKLFSEDQKLKDVNIRIEGMESERAGRQSSSLDNNLFKRFFGLFTASISSMLASVSSPTTEPYVVSRIVQEKYFCPRPDDHFGCVWETVFSGDNNTNDMIMVGASVIRSSENWAVNRNANDMFFPESGQLFDGIRPFDYAGDPSVEVFQDKFYLATNAVGARNIEGEWITYTVGGFYKGCMRDSTSCVPMARLFKDIPQDFPLLEARALPHGALISDYPKIAVNRENGVIYIVSNVLSNDLYRHGAFFISRDDGENFEEAPLNLPSSLMQIPMMQNIEVGLDGKLYVLGWSTYYNPDSIAGGDFRMMLLRFNSSGNFEDAKLVYRLEDAVKFFINPTISSVSNRA